MGNKGQTTFDFRIGLQQKYFKVMKVKVKKGSTHCPKLNMIEEQERCEPFQDDRELLWVWMRTGLDENGFG